MRKIKFRAWSKEVEKMYQWIDIKRFGNLNKLISLNHVIVMQYTGLKDKNGNEIYEGDVLSDWTETDEGELQSKCQVFYCEKKGQWRLDLSHKQDKTYSAPLWKELRDFDYEITGNIHYFSVS